MEKPAWFEQLLQSLLKGHMLMDPSAWAPPNVFLLDPLIADLWLTKVLKAKQALEQRGISFRDVAAQLTNPSCVRKEFRYALWGGKLLGWSTARIMEVVEFYRDMLLPRAQEDPFALQHAYGHTPEQIAQILQTTQWSPATPESKKVVAQLSANCPPLAWALFTDFFYHRAYELSGLYTGLEKQDKRFAAGDVLLIRQYGPFRCPEIWQHSANFPINRLTIACIYDNLHGDFDYINHFTTADNIPEKLKWYSAEVDGVQTEEVAKLARYNAEIIQMAANQGKYFNDLGIEGQKRVMVFAKHFAFQDVFTTAGMSWLPEKALLDRVLGKPLLAVQFPKLKTQKDKEAFWRELFDPFTPFSSPDFLLAQKQVTTARGKI